jgi:hypothetical protein
LTSAKRSSETSSSIYNGDWSLSGQSPFLMRDI